MADLFKSYIDMKLGILSAPRWLAEYRQSEFRRFRELPFETNSLFKKDSEARGRLMIDEQRMLGVLMDSKLEGSVEYEFEAEGKDIEEKDILSGGDGELLRKLVLADGSPPDKIQHLNNALFATGKFVRMLGEGAGSARLVERTVGAFEISKDVFYIQGGTKEKLSLEFINSSEGARIYKNIDVFVGESADLDFLLLQRLRPDVLASINLNIHADGRVSLLSIDNGGEHVRYKMCFELLGDGVVYTQNSVMRGRGTADVDVTNLVRHVGRGTKSTVNFRISADDESRFTIKDVITIEAEAGNSDAFLSSSGLILSENAKINSIPALEIKVSDVKAKHSASTRHPNYEEELYLMSRGLDEPETKEMIVEGFLLGRLGLDDRLRLETARDVIAIR